MAQIIGAMNQEELLKVNKAGYITDIIDRKTAEILYGYDVYGQWEDEGIEGEQVVRVHVDCDTNDLLDFSGR